MGPSDEECGGLEAWPPFCQASSGTFWGCLFSPLIWKQLVSGLSLGSLPDTGPQWAVTWVTPNLPWP